MPDTSRKEALGRLLDERRLALGLTWRETATQAGVSYEAVRSAHRSPNAGVAELTAAGIERALRLERGAIRRFLDGDAVALPAAEGAPEGATYSITGLTEEEFAVLSAYRDGLRRPR